jgi:hypothetical protein
VGRSNHQKGYRSYQGRKQVRDFKNPYYDGPDCVCCKNTAEAERERILRILERKLSQVVKSKAKKITANDLNDLVDEIAH